MLRSQLPEESRALFDTLIDDISTASARKIPAKSSERMESIKRLHAEGLTARQIASELGISRGRVYTLAGIHDFSLRQTGEASS